MDNLNLKSAIAASLLLFASASSFAATTISLANSAGFGIDSNNIMIQNIQVNNAVPNPFDPLHPTISTSTYNVPFTFQPANLYLVPNLSGSIVASGSTSSRCATLTARTTDAVTGLAIPNVSLTSNGTTVMSDATGTGTLSGLVAGVTSLSASTANYSTTTRQVTLSCTAGAVNSIGISLSPLTGLGAMSANSARITLTWGANPSDLDAHLTAPSIMSNGSLTDTTNRVHTYYGNRVTDVAVLDIDKMNGFGPETITISPPTGSTTLRPGLYRYSVHHYSGRGFINTSNASVTLTLGGQQQTFLPPAGTLMGRNDVWTVLELAVSSSGATTIYPVNTYSSVISSSAVRTTRTGYGDIERNVDFARLPAKH